MTPPVVTSPQPPNAPNAAVANGTGIADPAAYEALRGAAVDNEVYQGQRLHYQSNQSGVEDFNPLGFAFTRVMVLRFLGLSTLTWTAWIPLFPIFLIAAVAGGTGGITVVAVVAAIGLTVLWIVFFFRPIPIALAEWKFLVDDKAAAAATAFEHVAWAFRRRQSPIASLRVRRLSVAGQGSRDYLHVRAGVFTGYVSCFPYGGDLYIGWTFWWNLSPFRWCLIGLGRLWQMMTMRGTQIHILARYESGKALREALHGAAREGIDVATGTISAEGAGTIGSEIPVELVSAPTELPAFLARAEAPGQEG